MEEAKGQIFSELIFLILEQLEKRTLIKIFIIHQAPQEDINKIKKIYQKFKVNFKVKSFFHNIYDEIYNADVIISRCGASTLAEIEYFNKFSILFPLPLQQIIISIIMLMNSKKK